MQDRVDDGEAPAAADLRVLLGHAREWSGGEELWKRLRARIEESFAELVILPCLIEVLETHRSFTDALGSVSKVRKIKSHGQLKRERTRLEQVQMDLHEEVTETRERFRNRLTAAADGLKLKDRAVRQQFIQELGAGFEGLLESVEKVTGDLNVSLIAPIRDALKEKKGVYELEEEMCGVLDPARAKDLTRAFDVFSRRLPVLSRGQGTLEVRARQDDEEAVKNLEQTERDARRLYQNMRECLAARGEFTLQGQADSIRRALGGLLEQQADAITSACVSRLPDLSLAQTIDSARRARSRTELLALPAEFFTLPTAVDQRHHEQIEVIGKTNTVEHYKTGTCFKDKKTRIVTKDVEGKVSYVDLALPDEDGMARQWADGVRGGEDSLWETLCNWMVEALRESSVNFTLAIESVLRLADRALEQQQQLAADEYETVVELWKRIDMEVNRLVGSRNRLEGAGKSERK